MADESNVDQLTSVTDDFTPEQLRLMAEWAVEDGTLTQDESSQALSSAGVTLEADTRTPDAIAIDEAFPPARPEQYDLPPMNDTGADYTPAQHAADSAVRGWLSDARLPREIGTSIAQDADQLSRQLATMTDAQRVIWARGERLRLDQIWRDQAPQKIALAQQLVGEMESKRPGLRHMLERTGLGNSAFLIVQLAEQAARLQARKK